MDLSTRRSRDCGISLAKCPNCSSLLNLRSLISRVASENHTTTDIMAFAATYHLAQAGLCAYTGYMSYTAITKLQQYEEKSKKLAKFSSIAAEQLHKTRTTQASGAIAVSRAHSPKYCSANSSLDPVIFPFLSLSSFFSIREHQNSPCALHCHLNRTQSCL